MARKRRTAKGLSVDAYLGGQLRDAEARRHFEQRRLVHEVALAVRRMREEADLTQFELAKRIGTTQSTVARLESGLDERMPRWDTLNRLAPALGRNLKVVFSPRRRTSRPSPLVEVEDAE